MTALSPISPSQLALWQLRAMGDTAVVRAGLPVVVNNLVVAESLGQLRLDMDEQVCTGFVAWVRLTAEQLRLVARHHVLAFTGSDDTPHGEVLFVIEQMNTQPGQLGRRMRYCAALPGVKILAGWRGGRLRTHRVRAI
jgi:hypothetical protein